MAETAENSPSNIRLLRKRELAALLGVSEFTLGRWVKQSLMPKPIKIGARTVAWRECEILQWLEEKKANA